MMLTDFGIRNVKTQFDNNNIGLVKKANSDHDGAIAIVHSLLELCEASYLSFAQIEKYSDRFVP